MSSVASAIIAPALLLGLVVILLIFVVFYYWLRTSFVRCPWSSTENSAETHSEDTFTLSDTLPPSYSGLSVRTLPPSYNTACRIIEYRPSAESLTEEYTNEDFETDNQSPHNEGSSSNLSLNNNINFFHSGCGDQVSNTHM